MKQSAVENLVEKILVKQELHIDEEGEWIDIPKIEYVNGYKSHIDLSEFINQAKEMEKQQIIDAYKSGRADVINKNNINPIQYYNETF
jgi:hypothetical protein